MIHPHFMYPWFVLFYCCILVIPINITPFSLLIFSPVDGRLDHFQLLTTVNNVAKNIFVMKELMQGAPGWFSSLSI